MTPTAKSARAATTELFPPELLTASGTQSACLAPGGRGCQDHPLCHPDQLRAERDTGCIEAPAPQLQLQDLGWSLHQAPTCTGVSEDGTSPSLPKCPGQSEPLRLSFRIHARIHARGSNHAIPFGKLPLYDFHGNLQNDVPFLEEIGSQEYRSLGRGGRGDGTCVCSVALWTQENSLSASQIQTHANVYLEWLTRSICQRTEMFPIVLFCVC